MCTGSAWGSKPSDHGVPRLVIGDQPLLILAHDAGLLLRPGDHPLDGVLQFLHPDFLLVAAGGQQRRLVDHVGQVGAGETRRPAGQHVHVHTVIQGLAPGMHLENLLPAEQVGEVDRDLAVKAPRTQQGRVEDVRTVGGGDNDDSLVGAETVHLHQQLVQGLLTLVVATPEACAPVPPDGIDLVHEDDAGGALLGLLEQVPHPGGAHPDEHLHEVGAADAEEGHPGLAGDRPGQQSLTGARRAEEQHALGNPGAHVVVSLRVLEELDDLLQLFLGLVHPGHVFEGDLLLLGIQKVRPAAPELHHPVAAPLGLLQHEKDKPHDQQDGQQGGEQPRPPGCALGGG